MEPAVRREHSHAIGADECDPRVMGRFDQLRFQCGPRLASLREARSHHERDRDPALAALLDCTIHVSGPHRHQRQVRGFR